MPRISFAIKQAVFYFILLIITSAVLGYFVFKASSNKVLENAMTSLSHSNESLVSGFNNYLLDIQKDIQFMSKNPFLYEYIQHPEDKLLKERLSAEFLALLITNEKYLQFRLIGQKDNGKEIIRAEKTIEGHQVVSEDLLQIKGDRDYFIETIRLPEDSIYYSEINLNQEYGKITTPMVATMRMAIPIYSNNKPFGILIANIDLRSVFKEFQDISNKNYSLTLFNNNGYYLIHSDSSKLFGFEFGRKAELNSTNFDFNAARFLNNDIIENDIYSIISYSYPKTNYQLYFCLSADRNTVLSVFNKWKTDILYITILIILSSLAIALLWTNRQTKLFKNLTYSIIHFGKSQNEIPLDINRNDEIGDLYKSFQKMANEIKSQINELEVSRSNEEEANKAKQEFLENMSHEIRNPLQSILGISGMLAQNNPRPDQFAFIESLKFSTQNLLSLVNDILDYRKLLHGQIELKFEELKLNEFLEQIVKTQTFEAISNKINLVLDLQDSLKNKTFTTDSTRLSQILINLISNAIRHSKSHSEVKLKVFKNNADQLQFQVIDHGQGLSALNIENIHRQKSLVDVNKQNQNIGLGLPIVINLLKLYQSKLEIQSTFGEGSIFGFQLSSQLNETNAQKNNPESINRLPNIYLNRLACIEDDKMNAFYYEEIFKKNEVAISTYSSAEEFISNPNDDFDLIITDYNLVHGSILNNLDHLKKKLQPKGLIFLISAIDLDLKNNIEISAKFDACLLKPIQSDQLFNVLNEKIFYKYFDEPNFEQLYLNYDHDSLKVRQVLQIMIKEWEEMYSNFQTSIFNKDLDIFNKMYHKLINSLRTLKLNKFSSNFEELKNLFGKNELAFSSQSKKLKFAFEYYLTIFRDKVDKIKSNEGQI